MTDEQKHLMLCLAEECAEVAQRVTKALRFGLHETQPTKPDAGDNEERLAGEIVDLQTVIELLKDEGLLLQLNDRQKVMALSARKVERIKKYMDYSRQRDML